MEKLGLCGVKAPFKFVPEFVFSLDRELIKCFLYGHYMGDGCYSEAKESSVSGIGRTTHYTSSWKLADDLQRLIFLSGSYSTISIRPPRASVMKDGRAIIGNYPEHCVSVWGSKGLSIQRKDNITIRHYDGKVYCAKSPHTILL